MGIVLFRSGKPRSLFRIQGLRAFENLALRVGGRRVEACRRNISHASNYACAYGQVGAGGKTLSRSGFGGYGLAGVAALATLLALETPLQALMRLCDPRAADSVEAACAAIGFDV